MYQSYIQALKCGKNKGMCNIRLVRIGTREYVVTETWFLYKYSMNLKAFRSLAEHNRHLS